MRRKNYGHIYAAIFMVLIVLTMAVCGGIHVALDYVIVFVGAWVSSWVGCCIICAVAEFIHFLQTRPAPGPVGRKPENHPVEAEPECETLENDVSRLGPWYRRI